ncbi:MAG TPA: carboxypeptidase regulatory-like domain-containing protein, partial [Planctomycetota bacterium]|nr:carboxypeptidase regulatory-like domain-containing protein [Planctomycetota bacterium]
AAARRAARAPAPRVPRPAWLPTLAAAASVAAVLLLGWWLWQGSGPTAPALRDVLAQAGAAQRTPPRTDWQPVPAHALSLTDGSLEVASDGRALVSIDLPQLGSVELPADLPDGVEYLHASLQRRAAGPTRVRLLRGAGLAHLPFGDVPLPQGCDLVLDRDAVRAFSLPDAGAGAGLPEAPAGAPTSLAPDDQAVAVTPEPPRDPGRLVGRIRRPADALPVPEALLILVQSDITSSGPRQFVHEVHEGDGSFDWPDLPHGRFHLVVQVAGYAADITRHITIDSTLVLPPLDIRLVPGRTVRGRVVAADTGAPMAGAVVFSDSDAPAVLVGLTKPLFGDEHLPLTHTDAEGRFELQHLRDGVQVLRATHAGYAPAFGEVAADADDIELRLPQGGSVGGDIRREDGTPWAGAQVIASFVNPLPAGRCMSFGYGVTNDQGYYQIADLPATQGMVLLLGAPDDERHMPPMQATTVPVGGLARVNFGEPVPAGDGGTVAGYLAEADGSPAAGRMVSVLSKAWEATGHFETSMVDEQGNWRIEKLPADTYDVYVVFDPQFGIVTRVGQVAVPARGEARFAAQMPAGSLAGRVLSPDGAPIARADLVVMQRDAAGNWDFVAHFMADEAGAWRCDALAPGLYRAMACDRTGVYGAARGDPVLVGTGEVGDLTVQLTQGGTLQVHVATPEGAPVPGALVTLTDARGENWEFTQLQRTGPDGALQLAGVPVGIWSVQAELAPGAPARLSVELRAGEAARADLVLPR